MEHAFKTGMEVFGGLLKPKTTGAEKPGGTTIVIVIANV
jgi:hypothetical protein